ncbi:MAG: hypothetical protein ACRYF7_23050 [Janthinobacterium lividum]
MSTTTDTTLIQPMPVERDENGWWSHPGIPDCGDDIKAWHAWLEEQGLMTTYKMLEDEPDHPLHEAWFDRGESNMASWAPMPPKGDDWFTLSIHDTEDGPAWVWARRVA